MCPGALKHHLLTRVSRLVPGLCGLGVMISVCPVQLAVALLGPIRELDRGFLGIQDLIPSVSSMRRVHSLPWARPLGWLGTGAGRFVALVVWV